MKVGRDYPVDFEQPRVRQEFIAVPPGSPWYISVADSDLPSVYHVIRQAFSFAENPIEADYPASQRRTPAPTDVKVIWTLTRLLSAREYVISFRYAWPVSISIYDLGELCGYAAAAVNWERTRFESDDMNPRRLIVHVKWLPYPVLPLPLERAKCFMFYPYPTIHLNEATLGLEDGSAEDGGGSGGAKPRSTRHAKQQTSSARSNKNGWGQKVVGFLGLGDDNDDNVDAMDSEDHDEAEQKRPSKKRKVGEVV